MKQPGDRSPPPAPKADDSFSTIVNLPAGPKATERSSVYPFLQPPLEPDELGRLGHYRVLRLLGTGGMGMVFHAEDLTLKRAVALKVMKPQSDGSELSLKRFFREAQAMAAIKHDHLVTIYQVGQEGETPFIAMEFLNGETLDSQLKRITIWDVSEILRVSIELASGLAAIHEHDMIHRDIKPANIWLEQPRGRVKILDFGLARAAKDDVALTGTGIIIGTPAFLAPEQVRGKSADARSDLYSFGCVLYRMCTGRYPHDADNTLAQLAALVADEPAPVSSLNPAIPSELSELVMQLLAKKPADRPKTAAKVGERLREIQQSLVERQPSSSTEKISRPYKRRRDTTQMLPEPTVVERNGGKLVALVLTGIGVVALATLGGVIAAIWWTKGPAKKNGPDLVPLAGVNQPGAGPQVFLTDLKPVRAINWPFDKFKDGKKEKDFFEKKDFSDRVSVKGEPSPHGIFMHATPPFEAPASLSYQLDKQYQTFAGKVGLNDSARKGSMSPMTFNVYGDDKRLWHSKEISTQDQAENFAIPVGEVRILKLEITSGEDIGGTHGAWIEPHLIKKEK